MDRLLLIDKDHTLVRSRLGGNPLIQKPWDQVPLAGVTLERLPYNKLIVCSNQGGVDKGFKSIEFAILEMQFLLELFPQIDEVLFCPNFAGTVCYRVWGQSEDQVIVYTENSWETLYDIQNISYRKPSPGMLLLAMQLHGFGRSQTTYVGDRPEDQQAAEALGITYHHRDNFFEVDVP